MDMNAPRGARRPPATARRRDVGVSDWLASRSSRAIGYMVLCCCYPPEDADETPRASPFHPPPPPDCCGCAKRLLRWLLTLWNCFIIYVLVAVAASYFTVDATGGVCPISIFHRYMAAYEHKAAAVLGSSVSADVSVGVAYEIPAAAMVSVAGVLLVLGAMMLLGGVRMQRLIVGVAVVGSLTLAAESLVATQLLRLDEDGGLLRRLSEVAAASPDAASSPPTLSASPSPITLFPSAATTAAAVAPSAPGLQARLSILSDGASLFPPLTLDLQCSGAFLALLVAATVSLQLLAAQWFQRISLALEAAICALLLVRLTADFAPPLLQPLPADAASSLTALAASAPTVAARLLPNPSDVLTARLLGYPLVPFWAAAALLALLAASIPESSTWAVTLTAFLGAFACAKGLEVLRDYREGDRTLELAGGEEVSSSVYEGGLQLLLFVAGLWLRRASCGGCARSCRCCGCCCDGGVDAADDEERQAHRGSPDGVGEPPNMPPPRPPPRPATRTPGGAAGFFAKQPGAVAKQGSVVGAML